MKHDLTLVALNQEQITKAKEVNGKRKQITHAVICGPYGQLSERRSNVSSIFLFGILRTASKLLPASTWLYSPTCLVKQ